MIKVFNADERVFTNNGEKILNPLKAVILKEDNGDYELELETRIEDKDYIVNDKIIVCDTPWGAQGFRVYNPQKKSSKITCTCKHLFYDTASYLISDAYVVDKNCNDALNHLNNACDVTTPFTMLSDVQTINSYRCVRKSLEEAINEVLERWGGHLVRDNFNIEIRDTIGQDNGVTLRYGKNIQDIQVKEDWSAVVTKILPVGKDGLMLEEKYITTSDLSPEEANYKLLYDKPYTKTVTFTQDIDEEALKEQYPDEKEYEEALNNALIDDLMAQAIDYIRENCIPKINYSVKADIDNVTDVGDIIEVYDERLALRLMTSVISVKWDCIQKRYTEVNFGNFSEKLKNLITTTTTATKKEVKDTVSTEVMPQVEVKLQKALGGSYCIYDGQQILIVDKLPKEEAKNCIRINNAGIAFGKDGINGEFTSVWAIDGTLDMQAVNVVNLVADMIKGGTLKLGNVSAQQGKLELYDETSTLIGEISADGLTMYSQNGKLKILPINTSANKGIGCILNNENEKPIFFFDIEKNSIAFNGFPNNNNSFEIFGNIFANEANVVESGSNSNGNWVKFYDGTMICWNYQEVTDQAIDTKYGSIYIADRDIAYPTVFISTPTLTCSMFKWGTSASWGSVADSETPLTKGKLRVYDVSNRAAGETCRIGWYAIGKWK